MDINKELGDEIRDTDTGDWLLGVAYLEIGKVLLTYGGDEGIYIQVYVNGTVEIGEYDLDAIREPYKPTQYFKPERDETDNLATFKALAIELDVLELLETVVTFIIDRCSQSTQDKFPHVYEHALRFVLGDATTDLALKSFKNNDLADTEAFASKLLMVHSGGDDG